MNFSTHKLKNRTFRFLFPQFLFLRLEIAWLSECVIDAEIAERTGGFQMGKRKRKYYISKALHFF